MLARSRPTGAWPHGWACAGGSHFVLLSKQGVHSGEFLHGVRQGLPTMTTTQRPMSLLRVSPTPVSLLHHPRARLSMVQQSRSEGCSGETTEAPNRIGDATSAGWPVKWTEGCVPHCARKAWKGFSGTTGPRAVSLEMTGQSRLEVDRLCPWAVRGLRRCPQRRCGSSTPCGSLSTGSGPLGRSAALLVPASCCT